ncbi:hypothetical protein B9Z19DRAFT_1105182 [Tuber borchii]|uniref:Uncharacterized protein n=1 Tax=Tuber borchii TaxID=42251 RepID=A0A2T7A6T4_TUBBO|nr:hypothetical protein B9Z19DRAFT_1105182 [Tuber borchii]
MEYTGASIFGPERKKEKTAEGDVIGALSDQGSGDVMEVGMMDLDSSIEPSVSLREHSSLLGSWPSSYNNNLYTEGLCPSSNNGAVKKIPDSVDPGTEMPYPIDQGLDGTFASSFSLEKPSIVSSSTEPKVQLFLVDVRQTRSLLGENSAASNGKERFLLRHDHPFSFKFPMSLPEAPPNIGFSFSPRLESIPYENKFDQDKFGDPQSRPPKTAKRHYRSGTTSPDNVPLRVPVRMGRVTGETSPAGFQFVEPFHSDSGGLDITGPGTTVRVPRFRLVPMTCLVRG